MRAHLVQMDVSWEDPDGNRNRVGRLLGRADVDEGDLIVLPEMFDTGFSMNTERTADNGLTLRFLLDLADDLGVTIQAGRTLHRCDCDRAENVMSVVGPGTKLIAEYAKCYPFSIAGEDNHIRAGRDVVVYEWNDLRVAPAICYDLRFPELFRRGLAAGAEMFALGAGWPKTRQHHWRALLLARAIENQAYVLGVNRVGRDPEHAGGLEYRGGSIAVGPTGEVLGELSAEESQEGILSLVIDPEAVRGWRTKFPAWRDIRRQPFPGDED